MYLTQRSTVCANYCDMTVRLRPCTSITRCTETHTFLSKFYPAYALQRKNSNRRASCADQKHFNALIKNMHAHVHGHFTRHTQYDHTRSTAIPHAQAGVEKGPQTTQRTTIVPKRLENLVLLFISRILNKTSITLVLTPQHNPTRPSTTSEHPK